MIVHADHFFKIGSTHKICQDYTTIFNGLDTPKIALSDGCSSALYVDSGARVLVHSLLHFPANQWLENLDKSKTIIENMNLPLDALCATAMTVEIQDDQFVVNMVGDGYVVARNKNTKQLEIICVQFPSGAPYYLRYEIDSREEYINMCGDDYCISNYVDENLVLFSRENYFASNHLAPIQEFTFPLDSYDMVAIFSDGLGTFQNPSLSLDLMPVYDILKESLAFKNFSGQFVHRRCNKMFQSFDQQGIKHLDDFSIGVMHYD